MGRISEADIYYLFDELWPMMPYSQSHRDNCIRQFYSIETYFSTYPSGTDHDKLLIGLTSLNGIGLTIASGLIWSANQSNRVPFDKYTLSYAIQIKILNDDIITNNYIDVCKKIIDYFNGFKIDGRPYEVEDFVIEAMQEMKGSPHLTDPK